MKPYTLLITLLMTLFAFTSCEKYVIRKDPSQVILGQWELIEIGNWPNLTSLPEPTGYIEYFPDKTLVQHSYLSGTYNWLSYNIDSLLYEHYPLPDSSIWTISYNYYFFDNNNQMRLDYYTLRAINKTRIFKRKHPTK
jgi:hypothetical protein